MRCQISTLNPQIKPQFLWFGFEASIVIKETKTILIMETAMTDPIRYKQNDAFSSPLPVTSEWTNRISPYWKYEVIIDLQVQLLCFENDEIYMDGKLPTTNFKSGRYQNSKITAHRLIYMKTRFTIMRVTIKLFDSFELTRTDSNFVSSTFG